MQAIVSFSISRARAMLTSMCVFGSVLITSIKIIINWYQAYFLREHTCITRFNTRANFRVSHINFDSRSKMCASERSNNNFPKYKLIIPSLRDAVSTRNIRRSSIEQRFIHRLRRLLSTWETAAPTVDCVLHLNRITNNILFDFAHNSHPRYTKARKENTVREEDGNETR